MAGQKINITPVFEIGQEVFLNLPDSDAFIVTDYIYRHSNGYLIYELMDNAGRRNNFAAYELTTEKKF